MDGSGAPLKFHAGRMFQEGTTLTADTHKGFVRIGTDDVGATHFQWLKQTAGVAELDLIIVPDEADYEEVRQSSGRVYVLKFRNEDKRFFFKVQESQSHRDQGLCDVVNSIINNRSFLDLSGASPELVAELLAYLDSIAERKESYEVEASQDNDNNVSLVTETIASNEAEASQDDEDNDCSDIETTESNKAEASQDNNHNNSFC